MQIKSTQFPQPQQNTHSSQGQMAHGTFSGTDHILSY